MDVIIALGSIFILLMLSVYKGIDTFYPIFVGLIIFIAIAYRRGFKLKELMSMVLKGLRKSLVVAPIMLLIGAITGIWRASGTVAYLVYYGIEFMNPSYFILYAFVLCSIVSFIMGTSFGTIGTIGIVLMIMAKGGNMNINIVAGAIIAGAFFGDRCSPMSSSAILVSTVTETELYINIKNMFKTSLIPFLCSIIIYGILSFRNPLYLIESQISTELIKTFNLNWVTILPALIILVLAAFRVDVKLSMLFSIISGAIIAFLIQKEPVSDILRYTVFGYSMDEISFIGEIIMGGGIVSMLKVTLLLLISFALFGVFEGTSLLKGAEQWMLILGRKVGVFAAMIVISIVSGAFGGSQTLAIMLTYQFAKNMYDSSGIDKYELAVDIENTIIVIAAIIPWNIAGAIPAATLTADSSYIIYSCYLYLLPLICLIGKKVQFMKINRTRYFN